MRYGSLEEFARAAGGVIGTGPAALIFVEDGVEVERTIRHHMGLGFRAVVVFGPAAFQLPAELAGAVPYVPWDMGQDAATETAVNRVIEACPGAWLYYCYNAEFLFYPFCESRTVGEMLAFHAEERRDAMLTYVVDLYAGDLEAHPNGVDPEGAMLDRAGYFALAREGAPERQLDFFGGLRWRFEEHIPEDRRRIDRIGLFRAKPGLRAARGPHLFGRGIQHLRLPLAPQPDGGDLFVPGGEGLADECREPVRGGELPLAEFGAVRVEFAAAARPGADGDGAVVLRAGENCLEIHHLHYTQ